MTDLQTEQHRTAWRAVVEGIPGSMFVSHELDPDGGPECSIAMPAPVIKYMHSAQCEVCGEPREVAGLTFKCRDRHEVCPCGERYDRPKAKGCRRRKHPKEEE